jgi:hypothetical protein
MFGPLLLGFGWLSLKQAQDALLAGRLDDARRILESPCVRHHRRGWEVLHQVAEAFVLRGEKKNQKNDPTGAWSDLLKAEQLGLDDASTAGLRQSLTALGLREIRLLLEAGEAARAVEAVAQMRDRRATPPELDALDEAAKAFVAAADQADRGEFSLAIETMHRVQRLVPGAAKAVERTLFALHERHARFKELLPGLHEAGRARRWQEVVRVAEELLGVAPLHAEAKNLRGRAWKAIEPPTVIVARQAVDDEKEADANAVQKPAAEQQPAHAEQDALKSFYLWIDGVGGYLVCLGNRVTLGQATPESTVDVPLMADVSRLHAALVRDSEGYLLHALRPVRVNGKVVEKSLLRNSDRLTLGDCCQLHFRVPAPVSASARLDLYSGHRPRLAVDAVLLMADTLILGPGQQVHVQMPDVTQSIVLFRHKEGVGIRSSAAFAINGQSAQQRGVLKPGDHVASEEFSLTLESVGSAVGRP